MSLTNQEKENLRKRLDNDNILNIRSKAILDDMINKASNIKNKNTFFREFKEEYNLLKKGGTKRKRNDFSNNSARQNSVSTSIARTVSGPIYIAKRPKPTNMVSNLSNTAMSNRKNNNARERAARAAEVRAKAAENRRRRNEAAKAAENQRRRNEAAKAAENRRRRNEAAKAAENRRRRNEADKAAENRRRRNEADKAAENRRRRNEADKAAGNNVRNRLRNYMLQKDIPLNIINKYLNSINTVGNYNSRRNSVNKWINSIPTSGSQSKRIQWSRVIFPSKTPKALKALKTPKTSKSVPINATVGKRLTLKEARSKIISLSSQDENRGVKTLMNMHKIGKSEARKVYKERSGYAWAILYSLFNDMSEDTYNKKVIHANINTETKLQVLHSNIMLINRYKSGTVSPMADFYDNDIEISDEDLVDFMFLMWLDTKHDKYITTRFVDFLKSPMCKLYFKPVHIGIVSKYLDDKKGDFQSVFNARQTARAKGNDPFRFTKSENNREKLRINLAKQQGNLISKIIALFPQIFEYIYEKEGEITKGWERMLKNNINFLFDTEKNSIMGPDCLNTTKPVYVSLDQQKSETQTLANVIDKSKNIRNYVTAGNLIDPGRKMTPNGIVRDIRNIYKFLLGNKNDTFKSIYHVYPYKLNIKHKKLDFFKINFNVSKKGKMTSSDSYFELKINDKLVNLGATAREAKNKNNIPTDPASQMGKFMADGLQYILIASQNNKRVGNVRMFASGDGMACVLAAFFAKRIFKVAPQIMMDSYVDASDVIIYSNSKFTNSKNCSINKMSPNQNHSGLTGRYAINTGNSNNNAVSR